MRAGQAPSKRRLLASQRLLRRARGGQRGGKSARRVVRARQLGTQRLRQRGQTCTGSSCAVVT
jgi:hypothetical protein